MPPSALARLRKICLAFPDAHEVEAWGEPTFRVKNKMFAMYAAANNHHGAGHHAVWIKATAINQGFVLRANPTRYFSPPYVGPSGWIGAILDGRVNWSEVTELLRDGYDLTAPKRSTRSRVTEAQGKSATRPKPAKRAKPAKGMKARNATKHAKRGNATKRAKARNTAKRTAKARR